MRSGEHRVELTSPGNVEAVWMRAIVVADSGSGQFQSERRFFSQDERRDPRNHTKQHEKSTCFVTLRVTSWIVY